MDMAGQNVDNLHLLVDHVGTDLAVDENYLSNKSNSSSDYLPNG